MYDTSLGDMTIVYVYEERTWRPIEAWRVVCQTCGSHAASDEWWWDDAFSPAIFVCGGCGEQFYQNNEE